jgi:hypothetical protein
LSKSPGKHVGSLSEGRPARPALRCCALPQPRTSKSEGTGNSRRASAWLKFSPSAATDGVGPYMYRIDFITKKNTKRDLT